jgi:molybdate transport system ATP-binding protein
MVKVDIKKRLRGGASSETLTVNTLFNSDANTEIFGPSGCGKTTFLKILAGLTDVDEGHIVVGNEVWLDTASKVKLPVQQRNLGFVFQDYALFSNMTVKEHLQYGSKDVAYIGRLLEIGRMTGFEKYKPRQLSGGQQQRLAILRALSTKPRLLLMDEPFSALDKVLKSSLLSDLRTLFSELNMTCLVVTHQPLEEGLFADFSFDMGADQ